MGLTDSVQFHNNTPGVTQEEKLRRFLAIQETAQQFIGLLSVDGCVLEINSHSLKAHGLAAADVVGKPLWKTIWWQDWPESRKMLKDAVRKAGKGETVQFTAQITGMDKKPARINFRLLPVRSAVGEVVYLLPEYRNITDLSQLVEKLREYQGVLEQANSIAGIGYWFWYVNTDEIRLSDEFGRIFQEYEEPLVRTYHDLMTYVLPEDREALQRTIQITLKEKDEFSVYFRVTRKDESVRLLRSMGKVTRSNSGKPLKVVGTIQDITDIKSLENRLIQSENLYRSLIQKLPNTGVFLFDQDLHVLLTEAGHLFDEAADTHISAGISVSDYWLQIFGNQLEHAQLNAFGEVFNGKTFTYEHLSGENHYNISVVPLKNSEDGIYAGMTVIQDVTQRVKAAEKLSKLANRLQILNELGQLVVSNQDTHFVFQEFLGKVRQMIGAEKAFILLEKNDHLTVQVHADQNDQKTISESFPVTEGIAGEVWRSQKSLLLSGEACRAKNSLSAAKRILGYIPLSFLAVPITWQGQRFGVFDVMHSEIGMFTDEDLILAENVAAWIAIALNNAVQHEKLERQLAESEVTSKLLEDILSATLTLKSVLQHVVEAAKKMIRQVDGAAIHLLNKKANRLCLEALTGLDVPPEEYTLQYGEGIAGHVIKVGGLINVANIAQDERIAAYPRTRGTGSLMVAPIKSRENMVVGTISLLSSQVNQFTSEDEKLIILLAHQAGLAIENARLYETAENGWRTAQMQRRRLQRLTHQIVSAQEEERQRIARELHDEAGQSLTALNISLDMIAKSLPPDMPEIREALNDAANQASLTLANLRSLSHNLRPPALDRLGLNLALAGLCDQFQTNTKIKTIYKPARMPRMESSFEITIYRFIQEALTNVAKHANASEVRVLMDTQTGRLEIRVEDNGVGMRTNPLEIEWSVNKGMGLTSMEERLNSLDGSLKVQSLPGSGTCLIASVPLRLREVKA